MCRVVGVVFRGSFPSNVLTDLRYAAEHGRVPGTKKVGHPDGWGVVTFDSSRPFYIVRDPSPIFEDPGFPSAEEKLSRLPAPGIVIAHARHSSRGSKRLENTHPFIVGKVALAHNGTVNGLEPPVSLEPKGGTDSEILALHLARYYEAEGDLRSAMRSLVHGTIRGREFTGAIILASDGKILAGFRDYQESPDYYVLRIARLEDCVVLFQEAGSKYAAGSELIGKGELATVDLELNVTKETV